MTSPQAPLADEGARRAAIAIHDRSFLVEAGAGSGKTAVLAGRIAMLLADGVEPKFIAAVTFTEFAASELLIRVRAFVGELAAGRIPAELGTALPDGLSEEQRSHLSVASQAIDEITCSTIHGFCQRLITPYPVEADIDPGATVMDRDQADLGFLEIVDSWLREELSGDASGLLAELVPCLSGYHPHPLYVVCTQSKARCRSKRRYLRLPQGLVVAAFRRHFSVVDPNH